ncbi:MAG: hypothetical protein KGH64_06320 [Candidatus Micrarchaeota archaeon]|nr:hypothetical protein [Candidatus Micrarchaeota archaeon]
MENKKQELYQKTIQFKSAVQEVLKRIDRIIFPMFYTKDGEDIIEATKTKLKNLEDSTRELEKAVESLNISVKELEKDIETHIARSPPRTKDTGFPSEVV